MLDHFKEHYYVGKLIIIHVHALKGNQPDVE